MKNVLNVFLQHLQIKQLSTALDTPTVGNATPGGNVIANPSLSLPSALLPSKSHPQNVCLL